ncbi:MAG: hypothetical protein H7239_10975 [Flavobacterium sp.]|nr:hypothetical protein [Flavobacterium sp.]
MKPLVEKILLKEASIHKVQYDTEWFYFIDDIAYYLKVDVSEVDTIYLPMFFEDQQEFVKCATFDDILRGRKELEK